MKSTELRRQQTSSTDPQIREVRRHGTASAPATASEDKPYIDPVCGMKAAANPDKCAIHAGQTYYFCSSSCVQKFTSDPMRYLSPDKKSEPTGPADAIYTCPMDPEIKQVGPGSCPIWAWRSSLCRPQWKKTPLSSTT